MFIDLKCAPKKRPKDPIFDASFRKPAVVHITAAPRSLNSVDSITEAVKRTVAALEAQAGVTIVRSRTDLSDLSSGIKVILGLEQPPFDADEHSLRDLRKLGIQITALSHEDGSPYGGGFMSERPLTTSGEAFLYMMEGADMWLDVSGANHETARYALKVVDEMHLHVPVLASNTGCFGVYNNPRNLPDDVLEMIAKLRGVIGLFMHSQCLSPHYSLTPFLQHLDHVIKVCGMDSAAIGTDGIYEVLEEDTDEPLILNTVRKDEVLEALLLGRSFSFEQAEKIMSGNALRFLQHNLI